MLLTRQRGRPPGAHGSEAEDMDGEYYWADEWLGANKNRMDGNNVVISVSDGSPFYVSHVLHDNLVC